MIFLALVAVEVAALVLAVVHARRHSVHAEGKRAAGHKIRPRSLESTAVIIHAENPDRDGAGDASNARIKSEGPSNSRWILMGLVSFALVNDVTIEGLHLALAGAAKPFAGWHRAAYHLESGLVLGWPAALAAAAWRAFGWPQKPSGPDISEPPTHGLTVLAAPRGRLKAGVKAAPRETMRPVRRKVNPARAILAAWCLALAGMVAAFPLPKGWTQPVLHAWELSMVAVALAAPVRAWRRAWSRAAVAVGVLVAVELVVAVLGAWRADVFTSWDALARLPYLLGFAALAVLQGVWLKRMAG